MKAKPIRYKLSKDKEGEGKEMKFPKMSEMQKGNKNSNWQGGIDRDYAWRIIKENREKLKCDRCGNDKDLMVHHKDKNYQNNILDNLELLCRSCHSVEHNQIKNIKWMRENLPNPLQAGYKKDFCYRCYKPIKQKKESQYCECGYSMTESYTGYPEIYYCGRCHKSIKPKEKPELPKKLKDDEFDNCILGMKINKILDYLEGEKEK